MEGDMHIRIHAADCFQKDMEEHASWNCGWQHVKGRLA
jgi:hypothetical protein